MQLTFLHQASQAQVPLERWSWICSFEDGSELHQFNATDQTFHNFGEIDQTKLQTFFMRNTQTGQRITILFPAGAKLIHFYRKGKLEVGTPEERDIKLYCFGYEYGAIHCKFIITGSDEVVFTDDFDRVEA